MQQQTSRLDYRGYLALHPKWTPPIFDAPTPEELAAEERAAKRRVENARWVWGASK